MCVTCMLCFIVFIPACRCVLVASLCQFHSVRLLFVNQLISSSFGLVHTVCSLFREMKTLDLLQLTSWPIICNSRCVIVKEISEK